MNVETCGRARVNEAIVRIGGRLASSKVGLDLFEYAGIREHPLILRIRACHIIYIGGLTDVWSGRIGGTGDCNRWCLAVSTMLVPMVVAPMAEPMVGSMVVAVPATATTKLYDAPGHDSRAPVFEYNALYCPHHIIYLPAK